MQRAYGFFVLRTATALIIEAARCDILGYRSIIIYEREGATSNGRHRTMITSLTAELRIRMFPSLMLLT